MTRTNQQLVRDFFAAISQGNVPDELVTSDMTFWSVNAGTTDRVRFTGAMKILAEIFSGTLVYTIEALTSEDNRVVAEIQSHGTLVDGETFHNQHVFIFRIRDGGIGSVSEFMNQLTVRAKIVPLMLAAMEKQST